MKRTKILFCISSLICGGAEKHTINLLNSLDISLFELHLCYMVKNENLLEEIDRERLGRIICFHKKRRFDITMLKKFRDLISDVSPDIVVCVEPYPAFYAHILRDILGLRFHLIQIMHETLMRTNYTALVNRFIYSPMTNRCDRAVFVCRNQMEHWVGAYGVHIGLTTFIYNGINTEYFANFQTEEERRSIRYAHGIAPGDMVICLCAALRQEKRHGDLIDAVKMLIDKGLPAKILIVGSGERQEVIEAHIRLKGMEEAVVMVGYQRDVRPFIVMSDIVAICSSAETFSIAILEAMSLGKPLVASDIGGASEQIIHGENGFLFPAGDISALASSIEQIITQGRCQAMGEKSRELVCTRFTTGQMVESYQKLFLDVATGTNPKRGKATYTDQL